MKNKIALYVHWPFCRTRCSYCDFRTFPHQEKRIPAYTDALCRELTLRGEALGRPELSSLYFGGGTPSHIPGELIGAVMDTIAASFDVSHTIEKTMEMNPEDVSVLRVRHLKGLGFSRVTLGVQTFSDPILKRIGRGHTGEAAIRAIRLLYGEGIENLSVDLMTGLPGQNEETLTRDFDILLQLPVSHLSVYTLTLAEHTLMHRRYTEDPGAFPDEEQERRLSHLAARLAEAQGLFRYEISNFAGPGRQSRHNLTYWRLGEYLGCGLSAASFLNGAHETNTGSLAEYERRLAAGALPVREREVLGRDELLAELLLTGLRLREGLLLAAVTRRTGVDLAKEKGEVMRRYREQGLLIFDGERLAVTARGANLLDTILRDLML